MEYSKEKAAHSGAAVASVAGTRHVDGMREPAVDYWRLLALVLFMIIMALLYQGVDWLFDEVLPRSATVFVAGMVAGGLIIELIHRLDAKAERQNEPRP